MRDAVNTAERMRQQVTQEHWMKGELWDGRTRLCLMGHWCNALEVDGDNVCLTPCMDRDYLLRLHTVISEQYPEITSQWLAAVDYLKDIEGLIVFFNDHADTTFADIRTVIEKTE